MKLDLEIITDKSDSMVLLKLLAKEIFHAQEVFEIPGSETLDIDAGMNDIRAKLKHSVIEFWIRYECEESKYEKLLLEFCRKHSLTLRFNAANKG
jgi:hypothetical protein